MTKTDDDQHSYSSLKYNIDPIFIILIGTVETFKKYTK